MTITTKQQSMLFDSFPFDILINIFSYLNKTDCLQCMGVCKTWYNNVPGYTENVWTEVEIRRFNTGILKKNLWLHFVGKHVKNISFQGFRKQKDLYRVLYKLLDHGCDNFQYLEFSYCATSKQEIFLPLLSRLTRNVSEIHIRDHDSNIAFLWLMKSCPKLTRFKFVSLDINTYTLHGFQYEEPSVLAEYDHNNQNGPRLILSQQQQLDAPPFYNFTDLDLSGILLAGSRLRPILQKCPSLEYLSLAIHTLAGFDCIPRGEYHTSKVTDFGTLFSWCPNLKYLDINNHDIGLGSKELRKQYIDKFKKEIMESCTATKTSTVTTTVEERKKEEDDDDEGQKTAYLQCLKVDEMKTVHAQEIKQVLLQNRRSLKHLVITNSKNDINSFSRHTAVPFNSDWTSIFPVFSAPSLRSLILGSIHYNQSAPLLTMIQQCPSLEVVALFNEHHTYNMSLNMSRLLLSLKNLKHLELSKFILDFDNNDDNNDNNDNNNPIPIFKQLIERGSKLETIILDRNIPNITDKFLVGAAYIPSLKHIQLMLDSEEYDDTGICLFGELLNKTKSIEAISLRGMRGLSREFLCSLGNLPLLQKISFNSRDETDEMGDFRYVGMPVDRSGFFNMLHKTTSLKMIYIASNEVLRDEQPDIRSTLIMEGLLKIKYEMRDFTSIFAPAGWNLRAV